MHRQDPEQPKPLQHMWRKVFCINYMKPRFSEPDKWYPTTDQQHIDAGYCLDRHVLSYQGD